MYYLIYLDYVVLIIACIKLSSEEYNQGVIFFLEMKIVAILFGVN